MRARGNFTRRPTHQLTSPLTCFSASKLPNLFTADGDHNLKIDFKVCRALFTPIKITHSPLPRGIYRGACFCSQIIGANNQSTSKQTNHPISHPFWEQAAYHSEYAFLDGDYKSRLHFNLRMPLFPHRLIKYRQSTNHSPLSR